MAGSPILLPLTLWPALSNKVQVSLLENNSIGLDNIEAPLQI